MQEQPTIRDPQTVVFTQSAAAKVWALMIEEDNFQLKLRVFVTGGGCSGLQYGFTFDEEINDDDTVVETLLDDSDDDDDDEEDEDDGGSEAGGRSVCLLIDPMSLQYLTGAEIDYAEDVQGAQFVIRNPNAQTTCGCGSSFSV